MIDILPDLLGAAVCLIAVSLVARHVGRAGFTDSQHALLVGAGLVLMLAGNLVGLGGALGFAEPTAGQTIPAALSIVEAALGPGFGLLLVAVGVAGWLRHGATQKTVRGRLEARSRGLQHDLAEQAARLEAARAERDAAVSYAEQALAEAGLGTWSWLPGEDRWHSSEKARETMGCDPRSAPDDLKLPELLHADDRAEFERLLRSRRMGRSEPFRIEGRVKAWRSDEWRWVELRGRPSRTSPEGKVVEIAGTAVDLTASRRTDMEFRRAMAEQSAVFHRAADGIMVVADGRIAKVNQRLAEMFGQTEPALVGQSPAVLFADVAAFDHCLADLEASEAGTDTANVEAELAHKDGHGIWCRISRREVDAQDPTQGEVWIVADITEARAMQERLQESEQRLEMAIRGADLGAWEADIDQGFVHLNDRAQRMLRLPEYCEGIWIEALLERVHPEDQVKVMEAIEGHVRGDSGHIQIEYRIRSDDDDWVWVLSQGRASLRDDRGIAMRINGTWMDLTERKHNEQRLTAALAEQSAIFEGACEGIALVMGDTIARVNPSMAAISGRSEDEIVGGSIADFVATPAAYAELQEHVSVAFKRGLPFLAEVPMTHADGRERWCRISGAPVDRDDPDRGAAWVVSDITEQRAAEDALRDSEERFHRLAASAYDAIITIDDLGAVTFWNASSERIFGYSEEEAIGQPLHDLVTPERERAAAREGHARFQDTGTGPILNQTREIMALRKDGSEFPAEVTITPININGRWGATAILRDISDRKASEEAVWRQANYDALTNLPNRLLFMDRLAQAVAENRRKDRQVGLMFLDLDGFKAVNDTWGHAAGDSLLVQAAGRLLGCARGSDTVARLAGDEFVIILPDLANRTAGETVATRVLEAFEAEFDIGKAMVRSSPSIGLAYCPTDADDVETLIRHADAAMYESKRAGRNTWRTYEAGQELAPPPPRASAG